MKTETTLFFSNAALPQKHGAGFPVYALAGFIQLVFILPALCAESISPPSAQANRLIILGMDGVGFDVAIQGIGEGWLPNLARLRSEGALLPLAASVPATPLVAWADIEAGAGPGVHGIFDAVHRAANQRTAANAAVALPAGHYREDGVFVEGAPVSGRQGRTFIEALDAAGVRVTALFAPLGFPPPALTHGRILAGLSVPDLALGAAPYAIYTTGAAGGGAGLVAPHYPLLFRGNTALTALEGPWIPESRALWSQLEEKARLESEAVARAATEEQRTAARKRLDAVRGQLQALAPRRFAVVPFKIERLPFGMGVQLDVQGQRQMLAPGEWSAPFDVRFDLGAGREARGLARFYLIPPRGSDAEEGSVHLAAAPLDMHPAAPWLPISAPPEWSAQLAAAVGPFHTQGWPWATAPLLDERIGDEAFLKDYFSILDERERLFEHVLRGDDWDCLYVVFADPAVIQGAFRRAVDPRHPRFRSDAAGADAIRETLRRVDKLAGMAMAAVGQTNGTDERDGTDMTSPTYPTSQSGQPSNQPPSSGRVIVISSSGMAPFYYSVNLNNALLDAGLLKLRNPAAPPESVPWPNGVDWSATRAYALGNGQIFLNRPGAGNGKQASEQELAAARRATIEALRNLRDPQTREPIVSAIYDGAQVYAGSRGQEVPDLIVGLRPGYRVDARSLGGALSERTVQTNNSRWSADSASVAPAAVAGFVGMSWKMDTESIGRFDVAGMALEFFGAEQNQEE